MVTCPSTYRIFAALFLYHSDNKYDYSFQQLTENCSRSAKEKYKSNTSRNTSKKAAFASAYLKNYFGFDSKQKYATSILTPQHCLKQKQLI